MYECEIGQGLLGNSVARAMGGAVARFRTPRFQFPDFVPDFRISYRIYGFRTPKRLYRLRALFSCLEGLLHLFWEFRRPNCSAMRKAKLR